MTVRKCPRVPQRTEFGCARKSSLVSKPSRIYVYKGVCVLCDIFVTWDGATLEFESFNRIAEGIIMLAWYKQQVVIY